MHAIKDSALGISSKELGLEIGSVAILQEEYLQLLLRCSLCSVYEACIKLEIQACVLGSQEEEVLG